MTIFAPPRAGARSASLPGISTTSRSKESTASLANTVSAELPNLVQLADPTAAAGINVGSPGTRARRSPCTSVDRRRLQ